MPKNRLDEKRLTFEKRVGEDDIVTMLDLEDVLSAYTIINQDSREGYLDEIVIPREGGEALRIEGEEICGTASRYIEIACTLQPIISACMILASKHLHTCNKELFEEGEEDDGETISSLEFGKMIKEMTIITVAQRLAKKVNKFYEDISIELQLMERL